MLDKKHFSPSNMFVLLSIAVICLPYFTWFQQFINPIFTSDSLVIRYFGLPTANPHISIFNNTSAYMNTVIFFKSLGFTSQTPMIYVHLFSWFVFLFLLITIGRINGRNNFSNIQILFITFYSILYGIYFTNYSKDIMTIILFIIAINLYLHKRNIVIIGIFMFLYSMFFRTYWIITFLIWIPILLNKKKSIIRKHVLYIIILTTLLILIYYKSIFIVSRFSINNPASSSIHSIVAGSSPLIDVVNYLYVLASLIAPVQGFSSSHIILYYSWIWLVGFIFYKNKKNLNNRQLRLFLLFICFLSTQALFEPDFGSALRHQLVWFPLIYYIMSYQKLKNDVNRFKVRKNDKNEETSI